MWVRLSQALMFSFPRLYKRKKKNLSSTVVILPQVLEQHPFISVRARLRHNWFSRPLAPTSLLTEKGLWGRWPQDLCHFWVFPCESIRAAITEASCVCLADGRRGNGRVRLPIRSNWIDVDFCSCARRRLTFECSAGLRESGEEVCVCACVCVFHT